MAFKINQQNTIRVYKNHTYVGNLNRTRTGCEFEINSQYKQANPKSKITYHITTEEKIHTYNGVGLPPYFAGLLPEGLRLKALIKKIKTSADDMFGLLANAGDNPVGDLHFRDADKPNEDQSKILLDFNKIKDDIKHIKSTDTTNLAGVQYKISTDRISLPVNIKRKNKAFNTCLQLCRTSCKGIR